MTIEERLEVVERELALSRRRTRRMWVALGLAGVVCAIVWSLTATTGSAQAQGDEKVIRANQFIVEDQNGNIRARLSADISLNDITGLWLYDENGKTRTGLSVDKAGPRLFQSDENEKPRTLLGAFTKGPVLKLADENGKIIWSAP